MSDPPGTPMHPPLTLTLLPEPYAICRLDPEESIPRWALAGGLVSMTRTRDELSIVCPQSNVPAGTINEPAWRCLRVEGPLDLSLIGVVAALTAPLASVGVSVFVISTYDTDYLLVRSEHAMEAVQALSRAGYLVHAQA